MLGLTGRQQATKDTESCPVGQDEFTLAAIYIKKMFTINGIYFVCRWRGRFAKGGNGGSAGPGMMPMTAAFTQPEKVQ